MKKIKNNCKNFVFDVSPATCDICGSWENPADPLVKCGAGWADDEDDFCDNIICRQCRIVDQENKRVICRCCFWFLTKTPS